MQSMLQFQASGPPDFEPLRPSKNIAHDVARTLRHGIVTLRIPPGTMLSEQDVGRRLGVSRQPVREAFIKLAEAGLLVIRPQRGTQVVRISRAVVQDALFIRIAVECAVAQRAAARLDGGAAARLSANLEQQRAALKDYAFDVLFGLDEEFHQLLAQAAGHASAWTVIEGVKPHLDRVRWLSMDLLRPLSRVVGQHEAVFEAITRGDAERAAECMRAHVMDFAGLLDPIAARHPYLFEEAAPELDEPGIPVVLSHL